MRFAHPDDWTHRLIRIRELLRGSSDVAALRLVVDGLRPPQQGEAAPRVAALAAHLEQAAPGTGRELGATLRALLSRLHVFPALTESGVPGTEGFAGELLGRLTRRMLPPAPDPDDLRDLIRSVFDRPRDHHWVESVPAEHWRRLMDALGLTAESVRGVDDELALAIGVLAHHAASLGLQPEITQRLPTLEDASSPFLRLGSATLRYLASFDSGVEGDEEPLLEEALETVAECRAAVERLRAEKKRYGTSLRLTSLSFRLLRLLDRVDLLLHLTEPVERDFQGSAARLFRELVRAEKTRDHVVPHVRASADLLAVQIVEHAARKGSKYITSGRADYLAFLASSMGGGLLVAVFAMLKVLMAPWDVPLGIEALLYGVNYSLCFVLIYITGATLATKQPAMTANTVARSLGEEGHDLEGLEDLVVRVWRSQFISFVGNLVVALPVALILSEAFFRLFGSPVAPASKAVTMLADLHPWRSGTVVYAAMAGVLLFGAGLVSGWVDNRTLLERLPERVAHHATLIRLVGPERARRMAEALGRNLGAVVGNVFLGFGLGSLGTVGEIVGLPLDIRHIAFASAEVGTSLEILRFAVPAGLIAEIALGVALIGLVNFLVSFGLSLALALESRQVTFAETRLLLKHLARRLWRRPLDWFFPPRRPRPASAGPP